MIDSYGEDFIILDVGGVGYLVHCFGRTLQELPGTGQPATLAIETYVARIRSACSAFSARSSATGSVCCRRCRAWVHRWRCRVLGTLAAPGFAFAVALRDKATVARAPGIGPKVAERIVTELKDKAPAYTELDPAVIRLSGQSKKNAPRSRWPMRSRRW